MTEDSILAVSIFGILGVCALLCLKSAIESLNSSATQDL
jgi:hypothetical protein